MLESRNITQQHIVAIAGRKQAGKDTCFGCIRLWRPDAEKFSFARPLKQMAVDILGLEPWQAFGTDEQKRTIVPHLLWENFPLKAWELDDGNVFIVANRTEDDWSHDELNGAIDDEQLHDHIFSIYSRSVPRNRSVVGAKHGPMTAREVLQYWGTEIFRRQSTNVWADACIREIRKSVCGLAIVIDTRFPNEVEAVQAAGGKVIRLTRNPFPEDTHTSETMLDPENFDQDRFDGIIDNAGMNIEEQCEELYGMLRRWGYVTHKRVGRMHV